MKLALVVALSLWSGVLFAADPPGAARRVTSGWTDARGARIEVEEHAVFLFPQAVQTVQLQKPGCGRLVLIGPMGLSFDAQIASADPEYRSSFAGVLDIGPFCVGKEGAPIRVGAPAGRGTLEVVFGRGATSAVDIFAMLGRPRPAGPNLGAPPSPPAAVTGGHERFAAQRQREGAGRITRLIATGDEPVFHAALGAGCHVAEVAAEGARAGARYDLDAEVRVAADEVDGSASGGASRSLDGTEADDAARGGSDAEGERVLAADRSSAAEASLEFCLAAPRTVEVRARGAAVARETRLSIASFPFRLEVPPNLGASAKNAVERAFRIRGGSMVAPVLRDAELFGTGLVRRHFVGRAGSCHVAFAMALDGAPRNLSLAIGAHRDEVRQHDVAATVAFCTGISGSFDVEVESRGSVPGIAFLLYEVGT